MAKTFGDRMAALKNARHERFAQALAAGETQDAAYQIAGYKPSRPAASRLSTNVNVRARVENLQERAAVKTERTLETILAQLDEDRALAKEMGQASACVSATVAQAKLLGMVTEKVDQTNRNADVTDVPDPTAIQAEKDAWTHGVEGTA